MMSADVKSLPEDVRYEIFDALSHQTRVRILRLVQEKQLSFSTLKRELGIESSGQLQHHLQKLSGFVEVEGSGSYALTGLGRRALDVYASSLASGATLEAACCLPVRTSATTSLRVGIAGTELRLAIGGVLLALAAVYLALGRPSLVEGSSVSIGFGVSGAVVAGFFGISFLVAGAQRSPGCEVTAIPNLFAGRRRYYCACVMAPFNLPEGRFLDQARPQGAARRMQIGPAEAQ